MNKIEELLIKLDEEVGNKVKAVVSERDAEIRKRAQAAYDAEVESAISEIKAEVEMEYSVARRYLSEAILSEQPVIVKAAEVEQVSAEASEGPVVEL